MTIETVLKLEPELAEIAKRARQADNPWRGYAKAKEEAMGLVGFGARDKDLSSPQMYEDYIVYLCQLLGI